MKNSYLSVSDQFNDELTVGGLFEGIGGFALAAAESVGFSSLWSNEIDKHCCNVLRKNFKHKIIEDDIRNIGKHNLERVDIVTGGFPCQDISQSGKGEGITGAKSGLWNEYARVLSEITPSLVIIENSPELLKKGFEKVLYDLAEIGYDAEWEILSASDFGLPHLRKRLWVLAYTDVQRWSGILHMLKRSITEKNRETNPLDSSCHPFLQFEKGYSEPPVFGMADGLSKRLDVVNRLGQCGNAVAPIIATEIFSTIKLGKSPAR